MVEDLTFIKSLQLESRQCCIALHPRASGSSLTMTRYNNDWRVRGSLPWWLERHGTTRSHPEHGSETCQRGRYCPGNWVWKIRHCQGNGPLPLFSET